MKLWKRKQPKKKQLKRQQVGKKPTAQKAQWRQGSLPKDVMDAVKKGIPKNAQNIRVQKKGNKYRVLFERSGQKFQIFPWEVRGTGYNINPTGVVGQHQGVPIINIRPTISPHIEVKPNIIVRGGEEYERRREIRPEPVNERSFFEFDIMTEQLWENMHKMVDKNGLKLGINDSEYVSRWPKIKENLTKNKWKNIFANKWLVTHPLQLGDAVVSSTKAGKWKFRRDKKNYQEIKRLNTKYGPAVKEMTSAYETESKRALQNLMDAVNAGKVNQGNRNYYQEKYKKELHKAEVKFMKTSTGITANYGKEFKGKWV